MQKLPLILAIETSCDETAAAVVNNTTLVGQETYSQLSTHAEFGGVVPSLAKLEHQRKIDSVINAALNRANLPLEKIEAAAVTFGPGLAIALEIGLQKAKDIAISNNLPFIAVNHMHGHMFSSFADKDIASAQLPALAILVSGKHTELVLVKSLTEYTAIAETLDDACGEAFDKFARLVGLPYPGGPAVSNKAKTVEQQISLTTKQENGTLFCVAYNNITQKEFKLPIPLARAESANFSYSGLKTAIKNIVTKELGVTPDQNIQDIAEYIVQNPLSEETVNHLCYLFQATAFLQIKFGLKKVLKLYPEVKEFWLGGGVVANEYFRNMMEEMAAEYNVVLRVPSGNLSTDNAGMIGIAASLQWQNWQQSGGDLNNASKFGIYFDKDEIAKIDRVPNLPISTESVHL